MSENVVHPERIHGGVYDGNGVSQLGLCVDQILGSHVCCVLGYCKVMPEDEKMNERVGCLIQL
jgi:hypothetical protein